MKHCVSITVLLFSFLFITSCKKTKNVTITISMPSDTVYGEYPSGVATFYVDVSPETELCFIREIVYPYSIAGAPYVEREHHNYESKGSFTTAFVPAPLGEFKVKFWGCKNCRPKNLNKTEFLNEYCVLSNELTFIHAP